jgi:hypothetical protein
MIIKESTISSQPKAPEPIPFLEDIESLIENGSFQFKLAEYILGENATLEDIQNVANQIKRVKVFNTPISEATSDDDGITALGAALGVTKVTARRIIREPRHAHSVFRALRNKLEDYEYKAARQKAEDSGSILTMIIFTIRQALNWLASKFKDLRDSISDAWNEKEPYSSQTKRDYVWLMNKNVDYMANNTKWF